MPINILGVPQEEKALLRAFQERRKQLQLEAMQMAMKASEDARANYGKFELNPSAFPFAGSQMHSQLGPNPRLNGFTYDTSSENERTALALGILEKAVSGEQAGYGKPPVITTAKDPMAMIEERLRYGGPGVWDDAANKLRERAKGEAVEDVLHSRSFARPTRL